MSGHKPSTACQNFLEILHFVGNKQHELIAEERSAFESHRAVCPACAQAATQQQAWESRVAFAIQQIPIPTGLACRVRQSIQGRARRDRRIRRASHLSLAASLGLCAFLGYAWHQRKQVENTEPIYAEYISPVSIYEQWLESLNQGFFPTVRFNTRLIASAGPAEYMPGRVVPSFILVNARYNVTAQLFVLPADNFDLKEWQALQGPRVSRYRIVQDRQRPDEVIYFVVFTGPDFEHFLEGPIDI
jgi:hypothetical protein